MKWPAPLPSRPLLPGLVAGLLLPVALFAQAGLSGNALEGQLEEMRSKTPFTQGFKSKSALGQLEELTGSKVDRSSPAQTPAPRAAPKISRSAQMRNQLNQEVAGMLADALVQMIFSDNSAKKKAAAEAAAAEAAAQAAAQAEAFRVQEELARLARIQQAQRYRAEWDARETAIGDRLGDAFTVGTGTAFFGQPAGPEEAGAVALSQVGGNSSAGSDNAPVLPDSDPSVVDLRESSLVVQPFARPTRPSLGGSHASRWAYEMTDSAERPPPPSSTKQLNALIAYFGPWLGKWYWETVVQGYAKSTVWGRLKSIPGMGYVNAVVGADEQRESGTEELGETYAESIGGTSSYASNAAVVLASRYGDGDAFINSTAGSVEYQVAKMKVKFSEMVFKGFTDRSEMPGRDDLRAPESDGNARPIFGRGDHPDAFRQVLFGRSGGA
jgi:hypothetical protein